MDSLPFHILREMPINTRRSTIPLPNRCLAPWMADTTIGPRGEKLAYDERLIEILTRYDRDSVVGRATLRAEPAIRATIDRTHQRIAKFARPSALVPDTEPWNFGSRRH